MNSPPSAGAESPLRFDFPSGIPSRWIGTGSLYWRNYPLYTTADLSEYEPLPSPRFTGQALPLKGKGRVSPEHSIRNAFHQHRFNL